MKFFFDTSVLLPVFFEDHEHHEASLKVFLQANRKTGGCAAHSLAEIYACAARLPGRNRLSGEQVLLFLENIRERLTIVALTAEEYQTAMRRAAEAGIAGATIYDFLLSQCALKAASEALYTWNIKHFQQCGPEISKRLRTP